MTPTEAAPPLDVSRRLFAHYRSIAEVKHYYGLLAIYGFCLAAEASGDAAMTREVREILAAFPDGHEHPHYNFPSYRIGGIPRAYELFRGRMTDDATRGAVAEYADEMMAAPRDARGILCHPQAGPAAGLIWIDVAMAATPFLLFAGLGLDRSALVDEAARQTFLMYEELTDLRTGLLHQCKNFLGPGRLSSDHWSRGNGWGIIAVTELVRCLPAGSAHRPRAEALLAAHLNALLPFQSPRGLWYQEVAMPDDPRNWEESSGTGLILYALGVALLRGLPLNGDARAAFDRGVHGLLAHCIDDDGSTTGCCHGCLAPGKGEAHGTPESYMTLCVPCRDEPHSFGPLMLALVARAWLDAE